MPFAANSDPLVKVKERIAKYKNPRRIQSGIERLQRDLRKSRKEFRDFHERIVYLNEVLKIHFAERDRFSPGGKRTSSVTIFCTIRQRGFYPFRTSQLPLKIRDTLQELLKRDRVIPRAVRMGLRTRAVGMGLGRRPGQMQASWTRMLQTGT